MADHIRRQIRQTIADVVTGLPTTGIKVFQSRIYPLQTTELPALLVFSESESVNALGINTPRQMERTLTLRIEAYAQVTADLDNVLDGICKEVETALANPVAPLVSLARTVTLTGTEIELAGTADQPTGKATMSFEVVYFTAETAPDVAL